MDNILQQLGIDCIFFAPYHPKFNGKQVVFHKYLTPTLKKLCEKDLDKWDKYINEVLASYHVTPHLATAETPFFLIYGGDPNLPPHQLLEPMQQFLGDPDSGHLDIESHHLALAILKKTLDEKPIQTHPKDELHPPNFKFEDRVFLKNKQSDKWNLKCRAGYRIVCIWHNRHYLPHRKPSYRKKRPCNVKDIIHKLPVKLWNVDTMFGRAGKFIKHQQISHYSPKYNLK